MISLKVLTGKRGEIIGYGLPKMVLSFDSYKNLYLLIIDGNLYRSFKTLAGADNQFKKIRKGLFNEQKKLLEALK